MNFTETKLKGAYVIDVKRLEDERGFFGRSFCQKEFEAYGLSNEVRQTNVSYNKKKGTLRGMHMQLAPNEESKLVRCTRGAIYDVIIDMRPDSETYKQWVGVELTADNYRMLFVPEGFAHGFITLEDNTDVTYQVTEFYTPGAERCIRWNDPAFNIEWPMEPVVISEKDQAHPDFEDEQVPSKGKLLV
ncbi:dTDP-4-dehydrorhamnose 3,5-epimerase [Pontibacter ummariensis]|uniref:dTDP-4-dehydrorhamnose 3,5-epimerase n=1 Tax=Pontibacter ummariensis TaxID=1610492 RepID=A0A239GE44_9BACT|nr:dTDP-4-dehydrorhamnose 3,5-epimerase [Pontibacter ummariensis]PRY11222.1 dTDP-4-dehydrorhamnose 3,5-epimerase [Pontibacter ummariensis]SNS67410.1 dTDP-4-dehydrorhamnose 3,5-epimerase [Pontibacter ummariensis]